jgi:hypothetical protein
MKVSANSDLTFSYTYGVRNSVRRLTIVQLAYQVLDLRSASEEIARENDGHRQECLHDFLLAALKTGSPSTNIRRAISFHQANLKYLDQSTKFTLRVLIQNLFCLYGVLCLMIRNKSYPETFIRSNQCNVCT